MSDTVARQLSGLKLFPFCADNKIYFFSGRNALWHGMKVLGIPPDSEVLIPSYNCGAEIDPVVQWGAKIRLYRIGPELRIDLEDLRGKMDKDTKALLVTHYFGFPQEIDTIRKMCDENHLCLIEDCTHALLSTYKSRPLGSFGDISVFSLKKFLPVPDGGMMVVNNANLKQPEGLVCPALTYELKTIARLMLLKITGINSRLLLRVHEFLTGHFQKARYNTDISPGVKSRLPSRFYGYRMDMDKVDWTISKLSTAHLRKFASDERMGYVIRKRQDNFRLLLGELRRSDTAVPLFDSLPEGVCPSYFPVLVKERDRTHELLSKGGIFCLKTWPVFYPNLQWDDFPDAVFLKKNIISIPVHHYLPERDLLRAARLLQK
jgi:perosamine synthetase